MSDAEFLSIRLNWPPRTFAARDRIRVRILQAIRRSSVPIQLCVSMLDPSTDNPVTGMEQEHVGTMSEHQYDLIEYLLDIREGAKQWDRDIQIFGLGRSMRRQLVLAERARRRNSIEPVTATDTPFGMRSSDSN